MARVEAKEKDGDNVEYSFADGSLKSGHFIIGKRTGVIRVENDTVFLEEKYKLNVTAVDDGSCCFGGSLKRHSATTVVVVSITEMNNNKPMFENCTSYRLKMEEGSPIGLRIITVHASDKDKFDSGRVRKMGTKVAQGIYLNFYC